MSHYTATAEQLMRAGQLLRDLELATKRLDAARVKIKGTPRCAGADQELESKSKACVVPCRSNLIPYPIQQSP